MEGFGKEHAELDLGHMAGPGRAVGARGHHHRSPVLALGMAAIKEAAKAAAKGAVAQGAAPGGQAPRGPLRALVALAPAPWPAQGARARGLVPTCSQAWASAALIEACDFQSKYTGRGEGHLCAERNIVFSNSALHIYISSDAHVFCRLPLGQHIHSSRWGCDKIYIPYS